MSTDALRSLRLAPTVGFVSVLAVAVAVASGCSSDSSNQPQNDAGGGTGGSGGSCASPGAPAAAPIDHHCEADSGPIVQATGKCITGEIDSGAADGGNEVLPGPWGGTSAADDDCKYDVSYTFTPICEKTDVTFTVTVKKRTDHSALTGAAPYLEVLDPKGRPGTGEGNEKQTETSSGVYDIGPIHFNEPGKWTVRFHFFETCSDTPEDSPHGHAAFFIDVP